MTSIRQKMTAGAMLMVLIKLLERGIGFISTLILARLLIPADFGLVAMAMSVIALLELLSAFGFDVALIRNQQATPDHYDTAWTFNALIGAVIAISLIAVSGPVATFYRDERLEAVIAALALASLIQGLENIGVVAFRKELDFRREFLFIGGKRLAMFLTTIPLALYLRNYWALVAGMIVGRLAGVILSYVVHSYRPRFSFSKRGDLFDFSKWVFVVNILFYVRERTTDIVLGRIAGASALGVYSVGYEISNLPTTELVAPINRAVFPAYAKLASQLDLLRAEYVAVIGLISALAIPAAAGISATAAVLVPVLLGNKWLSSVPVIETLAFYGMTQALQSNSYAVYLALGKPYLPARINMAYVALLVPSMVYFTRVFGLMGAVWSLLGTALLMLPINLGTAFYQIRLPLGAFWRVVWRPLVASAAMYLVVQPAADSALSRLTGSGLLLAVPVLVLWGALAYTAFTWGLWILSGKPGGTETAVVGKVRSWLTARGRASR